MEKLGLDLGNSSMKIVGGEKNDLQFVKIRSLAATESEDSNHVVTIGEESIHFGVGTPLIEHDKTSRKYIAHSILLAAYEVYGTGEHEIALGMTLPISLYKLTKEKFKEQIEAFKSICGVVNGKKVTVNIKNVNIQAEGLAAFYALMPEIKKEAILFVDMGHRTTDIIAANIDPNTNKWVIEGSYCMQVGGYELLNDLQNALYPHTKTFFSTQQIEQILSTSGKVGKLKLDTIYHEALKETVEKMTKEIHQAFNDMPHREIYLHGGAAPLFTSCYTGDNLHVIEGEKMIYSNAVGSYLKL